MILEVGTLYQVTQSCVCQCSCRSEQRLEPGDLLISAVSDQNADVWMPHKFLTSGGELHLFYTLRLKKVSATPTQGELR